MASYDEKSNNAFHIIWDLGSEYSLSFLFILCFFLY